MIFYLMQYIISHAIIYVWCYNFCVCVIIHVSLNLTFWEKFHECVSVFSAHVEVNENIWRRVDRFLYNTQTSTAVMAKNEVLMGVKQATNKMEIITTILATFWLRLVTLSICPVLLVAVRHFDFWCSLHTRIKVQIMMKPKAMNERTALLMMKVTFSTSSLFSATTRPRTVLLIPGCHFRPSLLTI